MPQMPKEQMAALIAEIANRSANVKHMKALKKFIDDIQVRGSDAIELGTAINWLNNVIVGEDARVAEIKKILPQGNVEIDLTKPQEDGMSEPVSMPEPEKPADAAPQVSQGQISMEKGEPVLGAV